MILSVEFLEILVLLEKYVVVLLEDIKIFVRIGLGIDTPERFIVGVILHTDRLHFLALIIKLIKLFLQSLYFAKVDRSGTKILYLVCIVSTISTKFFVISFEILAMVYS